MLVCELLQFFCFVLYAVYVYLEKGEGNLCFWFVDVLVSLCLCFGQFAVWRCGRHIGDLICLVFGLWPRLIWFVLCVWSSCLLVFWVCGGLLDCWVCVRVCLSVCGAGPVLVVYFGCGVAAFEVYPVCSVCVAAD